MEHKILIVEDAAFARKVLKNALASGNYNHIIEAVTAKEAEEVFVREQPELTMLDITLPDNEDLSLLERLLTINPEAKIVMCSALGQNLVMKNALELGAKDFVVKPFNVKTLLEVVNKQLQP